MSNMPLAGEPLLAASTNPFLADHADNYFSLNQAIDSRDPLIGRDGSKVPQRLKIFPSQYNR
jgi:hypothetical protein